MVYYLRHITPLGLEEREALAQEEAAQNKDLVRRGLSASTSTFPSRTLPGPLTLNAIIVAANYPPAAALQYVSQFVEDITGWNRQMLAAAPESLDEQSPDRSLPGCD